jgi:hypothetical protein
VAKPPIGCTQRPVDRARFRGIRRVATKGWGAGVPENIRAMEFILWLIAVVLVVAGIVTLVRGAILYGILLIVVGLLVGPGGVSIFS